MRIDLENTGETDENQLSAKDVAIVARHLILDYPEVLKITRVPQIKHSAKTHSHRLKWSIELDATWFVNYHEGVDGLKLAQLIFAGACFVGTINKDG